MTKINDLLTERLKKKDSSMKMAAMAEQTVNGTLTSFSGIFGGGQLNSNEKAALEAILFEYATDGGAINRDLNDLISITSEVKAINHQAALLHGERIKKAQAILKRYQDGAFTAWLIATYGNRQTPYNFLQYYEFCEMLPKALRVRAEGLPRQVIYSLASREVAFEKKLQFLEHHAEGTKSELLRVIREWFPLTSQDRRRQNIAETAIQLLQKFHDLLASHKEPFSASQLTELEDLLRQATQLVRHKKAVVQR